jgi:hypothetical protein
LEQVKISLQEKKETKVSEEEEAANNEFDSSSTERSKGGNENAFSPDQSEYEDSSKCLSVLCYPIYTCQRISCWNSLFAYFCLDNKQLSSLMPTKGLQAKKQLKKRVAEVVVETRHESDIDEDESAGWVEKVQGEKKSYDVPMKVMSIKTPYRFSEEHGWIPVMQTSKLLCCPTCNKATKL